MHTQKWLRTILNLSLAAILVVACEKQSMLTAPDSTSPSNKKTTDGFVLQPQPPPIYTTWMSAPAIPLPPFIKNWNGLFSAAAFAISGKGYFVAGGVKNFVGMEGTTTQTLCYDPGARAWTQKADFPGYARTGAAAFVANNLGYVCTGIASDYTTPTNENWQYDPVANTWTPKAPLPSDARSYAVGVALNNMGYVGTGAPVSGGARGGLWDWWQYDPTANHWTPKKNLPIALGRWGAVAFANPNTGGKAYVATGIEYPHGPGKRDCYEYDPVADTWTPMADMPDAPNDGSGRCYAVGLSIPQGGIVGTGYNGYNYNDFYEFNFTTKTWGKMLTMTGHQRFNAMGFAIGNTIYVGGGLYGLGDNDKTALDDFYSLYW